MLGRHVGEEEAFVHGVAVRPAGRDPDHGVAGVDRLVAPAVGASGIQLAVDAHHFERASAAGESCRLADEVLVVVHEALDTRFDRGDLGGQLVAPGLVRLLDPHHVHRPAAEVGETVRFARFMDRVVQVDHPVERVVQLPSQLPDIRDAQREAGDAGHRDLPSGEPAESLVAEVGVGEPGQDVAGAGPGDGQDPVLVGHVVDGHGRLGRSAEVEPVEVVLLGDDGAVQVEAIGAEPGDRHLGLDAALVGEHVYQADAAVLPWKPVGRQAVEQRGRPRTFYPVLGERREVGDPGSLSDGAHLRADRLEGRAAAE